MLPSARKYESHGGPGIADIMTTLLGSATPEQDRYLFMKSQVLFWLLAATDGHAKNFSVFIEPEGRFRLTPFYDILSMYPAFGGRRVTSHVMPSWPWGLLQPRARKYAIEQIFPRHFYQTAKAVGFEKVQMEMILKRSGQSLDEVIGRPSAVTRYISRPDCGLDSGWAQHQSAAFNSVVNQVK